MARGVNVQPLNKGHLGQERLSSSRRLKVNYCYRKGGQNSVLCWEVATWLNGPLSEVLNKQVPLTFKCY